MSSTDKKKFDIEETSKQASVDITSDKIQLPADSDDHVVVATVPSAANCTAGVNVEVEMSPDGENWCPVQAKTVVSSAGGSTANTTIVPNQKYVNLEPAGTDLKDRHARGSLSFDINNNPVTYETGVRDMMHQHMDVGKSFAYSQWWKTSNLPTATYKPVLFRHGGYDNFENLKVVDLTDSQTQNLAESKSTFSSTYNRIRQSTNLAGSLTIESGTDAETFFSAGGNYTSGNYTAETDCKKLFLGKFNPHEDYSMSRWLYFRSDGAQASIKTRGTDVNGYMMPNYLSAGNYVRFRSSIFQTIGVTYSDTDLVKKTISAVADTSLADYPTYSYVYDTDPTITFYRRDDNTSFSVNIYDGFNIITTYTAPADITQGIPEANLAMYVNGIRVRLRR